MELQSTTQRLHIVIPPSLIIMFLPDGIVGCWSENRTDGVFDWSAFDHTLTSDAPIIIDKVVLKMKLEVSEEALKFGMKNFFCDANSIFVEHISWTGSQKCKSSLTCFDHTKENESAVPKFSHHASIALGFLYDEGGAPKYWYTNQKMQKIRSTEL